MKTRGLLAVRFWPASLAVVCVVSVAGAGRSEMVGGLSGPAATGADSHRGETELRCTYRGYADSCGASSAWDHASRSVSECFGRREFGRSAARAHAGHSSAGSGIRGGECFGGMGAGFLGEVPARDRSGESKFSFDGVVAARSGLDTRGKCGERVLSVTGARSFTGDFEAHIEFAPGIAAADAGVGERRLDVAARRTTGGAVGLHGGRGDSDA